MFQYATALLLLLNTVQYVQTMPAGGNSIITRDDPLPPGLEPVLQDDNLPDGDPSDALQDYDYKFSQEDLESCDDFDPDQETDDDTNASKSKRALRTGTTKLLRRVGSAGKQVREAFKASQDHLSIAIKAKGKRSKQNKVGMFESKKFLPKVAGKDRIQWQADHVNDLGIYTAIARRDTPKEIKEAEWSVIQDAILGEQSQNGEPKANDNTKTLGEILNAPPNIRGISYEMNAAKNFLMKWTYGSDTNRPSFYKNVRRSNVWGLYRTMIRTKPQFDDTTTKASKALGTFVKDKAQADVIEKYFKDEIQKFWDRATQQLNKDLKNPPPEDSNNSLFDVEDCGNTSDDGDDPTGSATVTTTTPPTPTQAPVQSPTPPPPPPSEDSCDVSYKFFYDKFEIRGKNFDKVKFGDNGEGLRKQLGGCGDITHYQFKWTPDDVKYQWYASGRTVIGEKSCIGHAVESAGGSSEGNCHGAG